MTHFAACLQDVGKLVEGRDPVELTDLLRAFGELMIAAIEDEQGFPEKPAGDQIAASWGGFAGQTAPQAALHACKAAMRQLKAVKKDPTLGPLGLRVNIGIAEEGPALAAELSRLCPSFEASVLVSPATRTLCADALVFEELKTARRPVFRLKVSY